MWPNLKKHTVHYLQQPRRGNNLCPSANEWIKKMWCIRTTEYSVHFSHTVVSDSWQPHGLKHARLPCPLLSPRVRSNSCPWSQWCHPTLSSSVAPFPSRQETALPIRWPKYWCFSISPSKEYSGLISFRKDWLDLPAVQETLKSLLQHHSSKASILWHSAFFMADRRCTIKSCYLKLNTWT